MIRINHRVYACSLYHVGRSLWRIKLRRNNFILLSVRTVLRTVIKSTSAIINPVQFQYCGQHRGKRCITIPDLITPFLEGLGKKLVSHNRVLIHIQIFMTTNVWLLIIFQITNY